MKYALNKKKGTCIDHPTIGKFPGGVAVEVTDHEANAVKRIVNMVVFDEIDCRITDQKGVEVKKDETPSANEKLVAERFKDDRNTSRHKR